MMDLLNIDLNTEAFFEHIEVYVSERKYIDRMPEIILQGLQVFTNYPNALAASLFMLKDNSYEFEHRFSVPQSKKDEFKVLFSRLIDSGIIGKALESGNIEVDNHKNGISNYSVLVPLVVSWGIIGIVVIEIDPDSVKVENQILNRMTSLLGGLFAGALENSILFKNLGTSKAVLEQKVAARTMDLAQSQRELKAILDSVQTGILVHEWESNQIIKANPVAVDLISVNHDEILGKPISNFLQEIDYSNPKYSALINKNFESFLINSRNELIPIIRTTSYVNLGSSKYRIECFLDITDRKKFEEELQKSNELLELKVEERTLDLQLLIKKLKDEIDEHSKVQAELKVMLDKEKELSEMKTRFVSMVSHEFRTPLTVIRSAAQMMNKFKSNLSPEEQDEYVMRVIKTVDTLTDLIENVLFIGKQSVQGESPTPSMLDLVSFTDNVINEFKLTLLKTREIIFTTIGFSNSLVTNEKLLRLILINLLSNAAKYSSNDTSIEMKLYLNKESFTYIVKDFGIGIPEEEQEKIFKLFYRADNVGRVAGTGIGLPVVLNSVQMLNGKIDLSSKINKGTIFTITIPHLKVEDIE